MEAQSPALNKNSDEFIIFATSYYNDQYLMKLKPVFEPIGEEVEGQNAEKRQRTLSTDSGNMAKKKGQKSQMMPVNYDLEILDSLPTLCPITNVVPLPGDDLLLASGHFSSSQLTIMRGSHQEDIPAPLAINIQQQMLKIPEILNSFSLSFEQLNEFRNLNQYIILSFQNQTRVVEFIQGKVLEIEQIDTGFSFDQETVFCSKVKEDLIVQATPNQLNLINYDFENKKFTIKTKYKFPKGSKLIQALVVNDFIACLVMNDTFNIALELYDYENDDT